MKSLDISLFYIIHDLSGHRIFTDYLIIFFARYLPYLVGLIVLLFIYKEFKNKKFKKAYGYSVALVAAFISRYGVVEIIRIFYNRPRPFMALGVSHLLIEYTYSFPSAHATFFFTLSTAIFLVNRQLGYLLYFLSLIIGLSRIASGIHYPSDIIMGIGLGITIGYILNRAFMIVRKNNKFLDRNSLLTE